MRKTKRGRHSSGAGGAVSTAGTTAAAKMIPRMAGPPTAFVEVFGWTLVSFAAYLCFLLLPGRLNRKISRKLNPLAAQDDLFFAGSHMHWAIWMWPLYDILWRPLCMCFLPRWELARMGFVHIVNTTTKGSAATTEEASPVNVLESAVVGGTGGSGNPAAVGVDTAAGGLSTSYVYQEWMSWETLRIFFGPDSLYQGATSRAEFYSQGGMPRLSHRVLAVFAALGCIGIVALVTYWRHSRQVLAARRELKAKGLGAPAPYTQNIEELQTVSVDTEAKRKQFDEHHRLYSLADSPLVPIVAWMCGWSIVYAACFAWVRGLPILVGQVYPACVCCLVAYLIFLPG